MGLERELEAMRRRLNRIAPSVSPPELKFNIFNELRKSLIIGENNSALNRLSKK
jgi:hypothetical protein